jgi:HD-GYP domain-containing protein (c-di-GMP phosphodiesterase class II)
MTRRWLMETESAKLNSELLALIQNTYLYPVASRNTTLDVVSALLSALESHCGTMERQHAKRTGTLAREVAFRLGLGSKEARVVWHAAVLHDIRKVGILASILGKPERLNEREWEIVRRHPEFGVQILSGIAEFERVRSAVLAHHERFDGRGYPFGGVGFEIPMMARLISVVDAYDTMMHDHPYRKALGHKEAVRQLELGSGGQFDPAMVEALKAVLERER